MTIQMESEDLAIIQKEQLIISGLLYVDRFDCLSRSKICRRQPNARG